MNNIVTALVALLLFSACQSVSVKTIVNSDGSFSRELKFIIKQQLPGQNPDLENMAVLPGKDWKITTTTGDETIMTATKHFRKGNKSSDLSLLGKSSRQDNIAPENKEKATRLRLVNDVSIRQISPGKYEYREILRWKGKRSIREEMQIVDNATDLLITTLPEQFREEAIIKRIMEFITDTAISYMFGPAEPMFPQLLVQSKLAIRNMKIHMGNSLVEFLKKEYGDKCTEAERIACAKAILAEFKIDDALEKEKKKAQPGAMVGAGKDNNNQEMDLVPLDFVLKYPGKLVSTNGNVDPYSKEIIWGVYPQAVEYKDIELVAVFTVKE